MSELYNMEILRLAAEIPYCERLADPDISITKTSRICGSKLTIDVNFNGQVISDYGQEVRACALGQASCSIVGRKIMGLTRADFKPIAQAMTAMLVSGGPPMEGEWAELQIFLPAQEHKSRHGSILLPFLAVMAAFDQQHQD